MLSTRKFVTEGKIIMRGAVSEVVADDMRSLARHGDFIWISDLISSVLEDDSRLQAAVPDQQARYLSTLLRRFVKTFFREAEAEGWHFIKTLAWSIDCLPRREFEPDTAQLMNVCAIPGSILVATENDTCLYGYGWNASVALKSSKKLITLNKGDIVLFRGDYIYAPMGYQTNRAVLPAYLDTPAFERPEVHHPRMVIEYDDTVEHDNMFCFVWNCPFRASGEVSLRKHLNRYHGIWFNQGHHAAAH